MVTTIGANSLGGAPPNFGTRTMHAALHPQLWAPMVVGSRALLATTPMQLRTGLKTKGTVLNAFTRD